MKNILVVSDLHYDKINIEKIMPKMKEADVVIFCGDGLERFKGLTAEFSEKVVSVCGNCDSFNQGDEKFIEVEGLKILVTHGHRFGVKSGLFNLCEFSRENGVDVAFFGHTHEATFVENGGVKMINPGAISDFTQPSYYFCTVSDGKMFGKHTVVK